LRARENGLGETERGCCRTERRQVSGESCCHAARHIGEAV
jgi:hypothetical protein